jgi:hypothetical protein
VQNPAIDERPHQLGLHGSHGLVAQHPDDRFDGLKRLVSRPIERLSLREQQFRPFQAGSALDVRHVRRSGHQRLRRLVMTTLLAKPVRASTTARAESAKATESAVLTCRPPTTVLVGKRQHRRRSAPTHRHRASPGDYAELT